MIIGMVRSFFVQPPGGGLHIDTEGNSFSKAFLFKQTLEIGRVDKGRINVQHIMKNRKLYSPGIQKTAGDGLCIPGFCISSHVEEQPQRQSKWKELRGQGSAEIQ